MIWKQNLTLRNLDFLKYIEVGLLCFLGTGEANLQEADSLLEPYLQKFPKVCIFNKFYNRNIYFLKLKLLTGYFSHLFSRVPLFCFMPPE